jgi:DNA-binding GntR family transcriptional regulator
MKSPLKRQTVTDSVVDYITQKIYSGEYSGGQQIRQEAVADELDVSRIPVREALLQLEAEGFVVIRPHRGATVVELTVEDAQDIFDARLQLEPFLATKSAERFSKAAADNLRRIVEAYEAEIASTANASTLSRLNWEFHLAIIGPSERHRSIGLLETLYNSADRYLRLQIEPLAAQKRAVKQHRAIMAAFVAGDKTKLEALLTTHIKKASDEVVLELRSTLIQRKGGPTGGKGTVKS